MERCLIPFDFAHADRSKEHPVLIKEARALQFGGVVWYQSAVRISVKHAQWEWLPRFGHGSVEDAVLYIVAEKEPYLSFDSFEADSGVMTTSFPSRGKVRMYQWLPEWMPSRPITEEMYF